MSDNLLGYVVFLHIIKTDLATHKSSREAGYLDAETANHAARALVLHQSGLPAESWDEYNERLGDDGEITIHGAIDTMQIVCFVWARDDDYKYESESTEEIDRVENTNAESSTLPREQRRSTCASLVSLGLLGLAVFLIAEFVLTSLLE
ncbi:MAG: hypothetical protein Q9188_002894 [Gyalolechia gomerana]